MNAMQGISRIDSPSLVLAGVGFEHRGQTLLSDVHLRIEGQRKTLVMGPNGAGKSLLLRLCHGLLTPTQGTVHWQHAGGNRAVPRQAMVFQRPVLLRRSALANLTYALAIRGAPYRHRKTTAHAALERFGLASLAHRPARVLSGGEQQRLALARAWLLEPEVLFLDEPTSALDPASTRAVESAVEDFHHAGTRIVMTSHDLSQARRLADQVVFICSGKIVEHSPATTFFSAPRSDKASAFIQGELVW